MPIAANNKNTDHVQVSKVNEVPPVPPPYHIAAAFSKKAALFQQLNQCKSFLVIISKMIIHTHTHTKYEFYILSHYSSSIRLVDDGSSTN